MGRMRGHRKVRVDVQRQSCDGARKAAAIIRTVGGIGIAISLDSGVGACEVTVGACYLAF